MNFVHITVLNSGTEHAKIRASLCLTLLSSGRPPILSGPTTAHDGDQCPLTDKLGQREYRTLQSEQSRRRWSDLFVVCKVSSVAAGR